MTSHYQKKTTIGIIATYAMCVVMCFIATVGCNSETAKKKTDSDSGDETANEGMPNPDGSQGGRPGSGQGMQAMGGFNVKTDVAEGTGSTSKNLSYGGFRIACSEGTDVVQKLEMTLHITKSDGVTAATTTSFDSKCLGSTTFTVNGLAEGDIASLKLSLLGIDGKVTSTGTTDEYTQAKIEMPSTSTSSGTSGKVRPQMPTLPTLEIEMKAP